MLARRERPDAEGMNASGEQIAERLIDHALPIDPAPADERGGDQFDREVAFPRLVMTRMAAMPLAVVHHKQMRRIERQPQAGFDFGGHWAFRLRVHASYIGH